MRFRTVIACVVIVLLLTWGFRAVWRLRRMARRSLYDSAIHTLINDTHTALREHFAQCGSYPATLHELQYKHHGDEFCESMLRDLIYSGYHTNYNLNINTQRLGFAEYEIWRKETH